MLTPAYFGRMRHGYAESSRWTQVRRRALAVLPKALAVLGAAGLAAVLMLAGFR